MTIEQIREEKIKAEKEIINILANLEDKTNMRVKAIEFETVEESGFGFVKGMVLTKFGITLVV